jgi:hypothetical protein
MPARSLVDSADSGPGGHCRLEHADQQEHERDDKDHEQPVVDRDAAAIRGTTAASSSISRRRSSTASRERHVAPRLDLLALMALGVVVVDRGCLTDAREIVESFAPDLS